jgi:hypothetical protein
VQGRDDGFRRLGQPPDALQRARGRRSSERLDTSREELAPRNVGEILDAGLDALRARFAACAGACFLLWLGPSWLLAFAPPEQWGQDLVQVDEGVQALFQMAGILLHTALNAIVQVFGTMVVALVVRGEFLGESVTLGQAALRVLSRILPLCANGILVTLFAMAGLIACVLPYFFLLWRLSLAPLVCASEGQGPAQSIARSFWLTKGSFLRWAGISVVSILLLGPLTSFAGGAASPEVRDRALDALSMPAATYDTILWLSATLFFAVATAAGAAITTAYYYDCRVRREALDLRARLTEIERSAGIAA